MEILKGITGHHWNFRRVGGIYQAQFNTVDDLKALPELDPKLWVALSCPVNGLEVDPKTLKLIDYDFDERVRTEEILEAVSWTLARMSRPEVLFESGPLPLSAISTRDQEGRALKASAEQILANLGKENAPAISVEEAANTAKIFGQSRLNGECVIATDATDDAAVQKLIQEIVDVVGAAQDRSGEEGVTQEKLDDFLKQLTTFESWWALGEDNSAKGEDIFPLDEQTPVAFAALLTIEKKIDDFFARCQLAAFDPRAEEALNQDVGIFKTIAHEDFSSQRDEVEKMPLAKIAAQAKLPLSTGINPAWTYRTEEFLATCVRPLLQDKPDSLSEETWKTIKARFSGYRKWRVAKPETAVESLGIERIREILHSDAVAKLKDLLDEGRAIAPKMQAVQAVEKLARYHRDLIRVLNNFVNFNDFYDKERSASFQAGVLYLDGRECRLCLKVEDPQKHSAIAALSRAYVAYCECRRKDAADKFHVAAIFSNGDSANLMIGRTLISFALGRSLTLKASIPLSAHCNFDERMRVRVWIWILLGFSIVASSAGWFFLFLK